jgi:hypothetical protein
MVVSRQHKKEKGTSKTNEIKQVLPESALR